MLSAAVAAIPEDAPPVPLTPPLLSEANRVVLRAPCIAHLDRGLPLPARGDDSIGGGSWLARLVGETELGYLELEGELRIHKP